MLENNKLMAAEKEAAKEETMANGNSTEEVNEEVTENLKFYRRPIKVIPKPNEFEKFLENFKKLTARFLKQFIKSSKFSERGEKLIWTWFIIGVVLHIAAYFWPELPENIPAVYGFYDHVMGCLEFIFWTVLKGLQALFEGRFFEFGQGEWKEHFWDVWNSFVEWIKSL